MSYLEAAREMAVRTIDGAGERVNEALEVTK
jgi:hypothetical protein